MTDTQGATIKTLYLIRDAKSSWEEEGASDFERDLSPRGIEDLRTIGAYLTLRGICPELILSSSSLRAQKTADFLADTLEYNGKIHYLQELYRSNPETVLEILSLQEDDTDTLFVILHNPELSEVANLLSRDHFGKIPALGIVALRFDIDGWSRLAEGIEGETEFFIYPKQFRYYMPRQIRATLGHS